ncbi:DUF2971 domain-containing protein [Candidatus Curtissbacteria bacterium]|nr:DUF2971 domain-containing protein [Bacteroidia bacterium]MBP6980033.1 DUF2971 domain-containing protein [Candidatus Curtissbacteria bacterium]
MKIATFAKPPTVGGKQMKREEKACYHKSLGISIEKKGYEVPIYRFIPFDHLLHLLRSENLWISQTKLWDDTYENFLAKARYQWGTTPVSYMGFVPGFYGQCWTLTKETDALWRIYSNNKTGVRIKSTIKKVLGASLNEVDFKPFSTRLRTIGKVRYLNPKEIHEWIEEQNSGLINDKTLTESLFIKRKEFIHEKEVRLIIHKNIDQEEESRGIERNHLQLQVQPNELLEEITFDPRLDDERFKTYKEVIESMGFTNQVNRSNLYRFEQPIIKNSQPHAGASF